MTLPIIRDSQVAIRVNAKLWRDQDPDEATRAEVTALLEAAGDVNPPGVQTSEADDSPRAVAWRELRDRFASRLKFGTAGLRGAQGAGPNRMNRVVVAQAARGFADFLAARAERSGAGDSGSAAAGDAQLRNTGSYPRREDMTGYFGGEEQGAPQPTRPSVVIGYDARRNSDIYAQDTAELMQAAGVRAILLPRALPTPVLAFAVRHLRASAGVMVTASHNPRPDNGYKVYLGDADGGSQIVPPADAEIQAAIKHVATSMRVNELPRDTGYELAGEEVVDAYIAATAQVLTQPVQPLRMAYTPLHGVGWETFRAVLDRLEVEHPALVTEQVEPDGEFPTVEFPNPEEPGTLDLVFAKAAEVGAQLVLAHDPDADRLAVAEVDGHGGWTRFTGNDIGRLLGWRAARSAAGASGQDAARGPVDGAAPNSVAQGAARQDGAERGVEVQGAARDAGAALAAVEIGVSGQDAARGPVDAAAPNNVAQDVARGLGDGAELDAAARNAAARVSGQDAAVPDARAGAAANRRGTLAASLVSSPALAKVAERYGLAHAETQTGFKWISRAEGLIYGYEEALGYLVNPETLRDKDGISAAVAILDLAFAQAARGATLRDLDDEFIAEFGAFVSRQVSHRFADAAELPRVMEQLRANPPARLGDVDVVEVYDYQQDAHPANILRWRLSDGTRVMVRPSGTEPKLKVYIDAESEDGPVAARRADATARAEAAAAAVRALIA